MNRVIVVLALAVGFMQGTALAAPAGPEKATELLAKAWMIDNRCSVLDRDSRDELTGYVARAEISLAEKQSVKVARAAIAKGRAAGTAAPCDEQNAAIVRDTLKAAQVANGIDPSLPVLQEATPKPAPLPEKKLVVAQPAVPPIVDAAPAPENMALKPQPADRQATVSESEPVDPSPIIVKRAKPKAAVMRVKPAKRVAVAVKRQKPVVVDVRPKAAAIRVRSGEQYANTAEAYYRELRCRKLSQRAVNAMYARVLREHRQAVSTQGKSAVRALLRNAEARASGHSC